MSTDHHNVEEIPQAQDNSLKPSIGILPLEVLVLIFELVCMPIFPGLQGSSRNFYSPRSNSYPVLTLSGVSSRWRLVSWSTPQLWCNVFCRVYSEKLQHIPHIIQLHLENSGNLPFGLGLHFYDSYYHHTCLAPQLINPLFLADTHSRRIQMLHLINVPKAWFPSNPLRFPQLRFLSVVRSKHFPEIAMSFGAFTNLRHVRLERTRRNEITLPWSSITILELYQLPIDTCAKLFIQCPNLVEYKSHEPCDPRDATKGMPIPDSTIILAHLQELEWSTANENEWSLAALRHLLLPKLHTLTWETGWGTRDENKKPPTQAFFPNLPHTIRSFTLIPVNWTRDLFEYTLAQISFSSIQQLTLVISDLFPEDLKQVICLLCATAGDNTAEYLPSLISLSFDRSYGLIRVLKEEFSRQILYLCRSRLKGLESQLRVEVRAGDVTWASDVQEELLAMVQSGRRLEIIDELGKVVIG